MACPTYPAITLQQATDLIISASSDIHDVINGLSTEEITLCDGSTIPTLRKALIDNFYFLPAIPYAEGVDNTVYNQLFNYNDLLIYSPAATIDNPISSPEFPLETGNWVIFSNVGQSIEIAPRQIGDGTTITFESTTTESNNPQVFLVSLDGTKQRPVTDYNVDSAGNIVFQEAPEEGVVVDIVEFKNVIIGRPNASDGIVAIPSVAPRQIGDGVEDTFSSQATEYYPPALFSVTLDGAKQRPVTDYNVDVDGNIVFQVAPDLGVTIDIIFYKDQALESFSSTTLTLAGLYGLEESEVAPLINSTDLNGLKVVYKKQEASLSVWSTEGLTDVLDGSINETTGEAGISGGGSVELIKLKGNFIDKIPTSSSDYGFSGLYTVDGAYIYNYVEGVGWVRSLASTW